MVMVSVVVMDGNGLTAACFFGADDCLLGFVILSRFVRFFVKSHKSPVFISSVSSFSDTSALKDSAGADLAAAAGG